MKEKTYVDDIDRSVYDIKDKENDAYKVKAGLTPEIVEKISKEKNDPAWMQQFRLQSLQIYNSLQVPNWGRRKETPPHETLSDFQISLRCGMFGTFDNWCCGTPTDQPWAAGAYF